MKIFSQSGTFVVPENVTQLFIPLIGGVGGVRVSRHSCFCPLLHTLHCP